MTVDPEVLAKVQELVTEVLAADPEEVVPSARIHADLGGESLDDLELNFRCEKLFDVRLKFQNLRSPEFIETDDQGRITPAAITKFKQAFPFLDISTVEAARTPESLEDMFTVNTIAAVVCDALARAEVS